MVSQYDIAIVGAGVAGASTAIALAPAGYRILLLDRAVFPRDKPCGEGIMPPGVRILKGLGLLDEIRARGGRPIRGMRYRSRRGVVAQAEFPLDEGGGAAGMVIRRWDLDHLLLERARSLANVTVREGFRVTQVLREGDAVEGIAGHAEEEPTGREVFRAPLTIGADGRHSVFHGACGLARTYLRRRRFGVTGHLRGVEGGDDDFIEVLLHSDGEIYVAPCGGGVILAALLLEARFMASFSGDLAGRYLSFLKSAEALGDRASAAEVTGSVAAVGPLGFTVEPCHRPGLLLIGDSAGFLDPITGEGMTLAMRCAEASSPLIQDAFASGDFGATLGLEYAEQRRLLSDDIYRLTRLLLRWSRFKPIGDRVVAGLSRDEALLRKLLGVVAGVTRYDDLSLGEKVRLLMAGTLPAKSIG